MIRLLVQVCIFGALSTQDSFAWTAGATQRGSTKLQVIKPTNNPSSYDNYDIVNDNISVLSRRKWISRLAGTVTVGSQALWFTQASTAIPSVIATDSICDPTVSIWKHPDKDRLVYLLGTAHISKISADLAGQLVRDVHPNAVFVELDIKRVSGIIPKTRPQLPAGDSMTPSPSPSSNGGALQLLIPASTASKSLAASNPDPSNTDSMASPQPTRSSTFLVGPRPSPVAISDLSSSEKISSPSWKDRLLDMGAATVGNALKGMYQNLGDAGFNPGDEFSRAMIEGRNVGATIVLGDQDVQYTLRRLTQALAATDFRKLDDPSFLKSMQDIMPSGQPPPLPTSKQENTDNYKRELALYVEKLKDRDNVRRIMRELREVAPQLVQVMLDERDAYMSTGIDTLNQFECIVAVMGLAHVDGVERNLLEKGWKRIPLQCPAKKILRV